jgi:phage regulator Rha-like protein
MQLLAIQHRIHEVRGEKVMLDFDLAQLYEVETRVFNQAVKRNLDSFPKDFMFRLTAKEWKVIASTQTFAINGNIEETFKESPLTSQSVMSKKAGRGGRRTLPYAFTEHGVTMLASVLKSAKAREMNITIVRAFIALKKAIIQNDQLVNFVKELKERLDNHDAQLSGIYDAIENLLDEKVTQKSWEERERIGFKK